MGRLKGSSDVVVRVHLKDEEGMLSPSDWDVSLRSWQDGETHVLPLQVTGYTPAE